MVRFWAHERPPTVEELAIYPVSALRWHDIRGDWASRSGEAAIANEGTAAIERY
jgi:hypothetical protein